MNHATHSDHTSPQWLTENYDTYPTVIALKSIPMAAGKKHESMIWEEQIQWIQWAIFVFAETFPLERLSF